MTSTPNSTVHRELLEEKIRRARETRKALGWKAHAEEAQEEIAKLKNWVAILGFAASLGWLGMVLVSWMALP